MSAKSNNIRIGVFVIIAVVILILGLLAFGARGFFETKTKFETLVRRERYAVSVPYEKIVLVPVCPVRCVHCEPVCHRHCCWF